jgi:flagellar basal-body rod modification protein FlgD
MEVNSTTSATQSASGSSLGKLNQDFDQFLRLLTTQLQNQDPLSPMDSTEFTNQLVSFSGVEQQIKTNESLENLLAFQTLNLTAVGLDFIGKNVEIQGKNFYNAGTGGAKVDYVMPADVATATISILDSTGKVVYSGDAEKGVGRHSLTWDGKDKNGVQVPAGTYEVRVAALNSENASLNVTTFVPGYVEGLETADDGNLNLVINGSPVAITDVRKVSVPTL